MAILRCTEANDRSGGSVPGKHPACARNSTPDAICDGFKDVAQWCSSTWMTLIGLGRRRKQRQAYSLSCPGEYMFNVAFLFCYDHNV